MVYPRFYSVALYITSLLILIAYIFIVATISNTATYIGAITAAAAVVQGMMIIIEVVHARGIVYYLWVY